MVRGKPFLLLYIVAFCVIAIADSPCFCCKSVYVGAVALQVMFSVVNTCCILDLFLYLFRN